jgi:hypothetical protein
VNALKKDDRNYGVLAYLGVRPRTSYLGRVRNPNAAMPDGANVGHTSIIEDDSDPNGNHASAKKLNLEKSTS